MLNGEELFLSFHVGLKGLPSRALRKERRKPAQVFLQWENLAVVPDPVALFLCLRNNTEVFIAMLFFPSVLESIEFLLLLLLLRHYPKQVESVGHKCCLQFPIEGAVAREGRLEVHFKEPGFELGVQDHVEAEHFKVASRLLPPV